RLSLQLNLKFEMLEKYFIILCAAALLSAKRLPEPEVRIIGGNYVPIESVPWQVALLNETHTCGGSVYNERVILTAAHCVENRNPADLSVRAGSSLRHAGGQHVAIDHFIQHEDYNDTTLDNDIAVIFLASPLELGPTVQPIELAENTPPPNTNVSVTGWGSLHDKPFEFYKEILLGTNLTIVDRNVCNKSYTVGINFSIAESAICAHAIGRGVCRGDSGGPVVNWPETGNPKLVGIVSGVQRCAGELPEFYTDVAALRKWIIDTIEKYF
ncbi:hypothetical protein KR200_004104, partial [Drosophila serrata]